MVFPDKFVNQMFATENILSQGIKYAASAGSTSVEIANTFPEITTAMTVRLSIATVISMGWPQHHELIEVSKMERKIIPRQHDRKTLGNL